MEETKMNTKLTWQDVSLSDDGTLDTVVEINGKEYRYSDTSEYRDADGDFSDERWQDFAEMVLEDYFNDDPLFLNDEGA
jgi:hypothetical protein